MERLLRSAREFGVVRIRLHEVDTGDGELRPLVKEAARVKSQYCFSMINNIDSLLYWIEETLL